jgi:hypothetical protein
MIFGIMTPSTITFNLMILGVMTLGIMNLSIMVPSTQNNEAQHNNKMVKLSITTQIIMLTVAINSIKLSVILPRIVMLSVTVSRPVTTLSKLGPFG